MRIEHVAVWTADLERLRDFYVSELGGACGKIYRSANNPGFESCFVSFAGGARLELMTHPRLAASGARPSDDPGWAHVAFALDSRAAVDELTARLGAAGHPVLSGPRVTGDGYYESVVLDPDGNRIEITA